MSIASLGPRLNSGSLTRGPASGPGRPDSVNVGVPTYRLFSTRDMSRFGASGQQKNFGRGDVGLGTHEVLPKFAAHRELLATLPIGKFLNPEARVNYVAATGKKGDGRAAVEGGLLKPLGPGEPDLTWEEWTQPDRRYIDFFRRLLGNSLRRGGTTYLFLNGLDMTRHFAGCLSAKDKTMTEHLETVTFSELWRDQGLSITSYELAYLVEGPDEVDHNALAFVNVPPTKGEPDTVLDTDRFTALYVAAAKATRTPENRKQYESDGTFTPAAQKAVADLQEFVHGTREPLRLSPVLEYYRNEEM